MNEISQNKIVNLAVCARVCVFRTYTFTIQSKMQGNGFLIIKSNLWVLKNENIDSRR